MCGTGLHRCAPVIETVQVIGGNRSGRFRCAFSGDACGDAGKGVGGIFCRTGRIACVSDRRKRVHAPSGYVHRGGTVLG